MPLAVTAIDHIVLNVADVDRATQWYVRVLGVEVRRMGQPPRTALHFGAQKIHLRPVAESQEVWFTGHHPQAGSDDLCFLTDSRPDAVSAHLKDCGVPVEVGPVPREGARGPMTSIYCRDPDGNLIEIASY